MLCWLVLGDGKLGTLAEFITADVQLTVPTKQYTSTVLYNRSRILEVRDRRVLNVGGN